MGRRAMQPVITDDVASDAALQRGLLVRNRRLALGITLRQLALKCKIDSSYLSRLETGKVARPNREILALLEEHLELPPGRVGGRAQSTESATIPVVQQIRNDLRSEFALMRQFMESRDVTTEEDASADHYGALAVTEGRSEGRLLLQNGLTTLFAPIEEIEKMVPEMKASLKLKAQEKRASGSLLEAYKRRGEIWTFRTKRKKYIDICPIAAIERLVEGESCEYDDFLMLWQKAFPDHQLPLAYIRKWLEIVIKAVNSGQYELILIDDRTFNEIGWRSGFEINIAGSSNNEKSEVIVEFAVDNRQQPHRIRSNEYPFVHLMTKAFDMALRVSKSANTSIFEKRAVIEFLRAQIAEVKRRECGSAGRGKTGKQFSLSHQGEAESVA